MGKTIRGKLTAGFLLAFVCLVALIFILFFFLFNRHNYNLQKQEMKNQGQAVAQTMIEAQNETPLDMDYYVAILTFLEDYASETIWIVDKENQEVIDRQGPEPLSTLNLSPEAQAILDRALAGEEAFSESFSPLLDDPAITLAEPIYTPSGEIYGAVLLHGEIANITETTQAGLAILALAACAAGLIALTAAALLAKPMTRPLERMKTVATDIAQGDYSARTEVRTGDELEELGQAIDRMAADLAAAAAETARQDQLRRDFVANTSHELRTPVTVIRGSLEALVDHVVEEPEMVDDFHQQMLSESLHLERLVNDLLDLSRLQNPDFPMNMTEVNLKDIAVDACRAAARLAQEKEVTVSCDTTETFVPLTGDYGRLRQMLLIALGNAIKFSPVGETVSLALFTEEDTPIITISDHGEGIPADELPLIFERFQKSQRENNASGTGLGLSIAREIAKRHEIEIGVTSEAGKGTSFSFRLPKE